METSLIDHIASSMADAEVWSRRVRDAAAREGMLIRLGELWAMRDVACEEGLEVGSDLPGGAEAAQGAEGAETADEVEGVNGLNEEEGPDGSGEVDGALLAAIASDIDELEFRLGFGPGLEADGRAAQLEDGSIAAWASGSGSDSGSIGAWARRVAQALTGPADPVEAPEAVLVLGQPGAGKGAVVEDACMYFSSRGQCAAVDAGEVRRLHPRFAHACDDPREMGSVISESDEAVGSAVERVIERRLNLVMEVRAGAAALARRLKSAGFCVIVLVVSADSEASWGAAKEREEAGREAGWPVAAMERGEHDAGVATMMSDVFSVGALGAGAVDELHVLSRVGGVRGSMTARTGFPAHRIAELLSRAQGGGGVEGDAGRVESAVVATSAPVVAPVEPARQVEIAGGGGSRKIKITLPSAPTSAPPSVPPTAAGPAAVAGAPASGSSATSAPPAGTVSRAEPASAGASAPAGPRRVTVVAPRESASNAASVPGAPAPPRGAAEGSAPRPAEVRPPSPERRESSERGRVSADRGAELAPDRVPRREVSAAPAGPSMTRPDAAEASGALVRHRLEQIAKIRAKAQEG